MYLAHSTWVEIESYLSSCRGIVIPLGSLEQHGANGLIGTDAICAERVASAAEAQSENMLVAPVVSYSPAQFNLDFKGSLSVSGTAYIRFVNDIVESLAYQGFKYIYFINGHGANIAPIRTMMHDFYQHITLQGKATEVDFRFRSWWDYPAVDELRKKLYGEAEGIHATPSEIAITMTMHSLDAMSKDNGFVPMDRSELLDHAGDQHKDASRHRSQFPDGRVGSDPGLADAGQGQQLLDLAAAALALDFQQFVSEA